MATGTLDDYREDVLRIADAVVPTWERRRAEVQDSLGRFAADGGYELRCVALCGAAS